MSWKGHHGSAFKSQENKQLCSKHPNRELPRSAKCSFWSMILGKKLIRSANNWNLLIYRNITL